MALRIKDDIDLKELEKYVTLEETGLYADRKNTHGLFVYEYGKYMFAPRNIYMNCHEFDENALDTLYDLIKDGLVEKVEE